MASVGAHRAETDLRKRPRRHFHYSAKILAAEKGSAFACSIADISQSGARLVLEEECELPRRFLLLLGFEGGARRICRLVWRDGLSVGVEFANAQSE